MYVYWQQPYWWAVCGPPDGPPRQVCFRTDHQNLWDGSWLGVQRFGFKAERHLQRPGLDQRGNHHVPDERRATTRLGGLLSQNQIPPRMTVLAIAGGVLRAFRIRHFVIAISIEGAFHGLYS